MTRYYDKHGTEIFEGDCVEHVDKKQRIRVAALTMGERGDCPCVASHPVQWAVSVCQVISRADGTPVYRYKGGEDVRERDAYRNEDGQSCVEMFTQRTAEEWKRCTLIHRAGALSFPPRRAGESEKGCHWCAGDHASKDCQYKAREVLGVDRNGKEVRRGDRVRCVKSGCVLTVHRLSPHGLWLNAAEDKCVPTSLAELVTDEKAERCGIIYAGIDGTDCNKPLGHKGKHCFADRNAPNCLVEWDELDESDKPVIALESLLRALAKPTMGERFEAFKAEMRAILEPYPLVRFDFDCDSAGMYVVIHRPEAAPYKGDNWWRFGESVLMYRAPLVQRLKALAEDIGREVLIGRAILRGGK